VARLVRFGRLTGIMPLMPTTKSKSGKRTTESGGALSSGAASKLIDERIESLADWRGDMLARLRGLIKKADPHIVEEWTWEVPVWSQDGRISTGQTNKRWTLG